jgi:hypothetical protein
VTLEPEEERPAESGTRKGKTRKVCNQKRKDQEILEPERKNRRVCNRKRKEKGSMEPEESV